MKLPDTEEFVTPVDDPCQYCPAWRSMVGAYLVCAGIKSEEQLKSIAMTGCIEVFEGELEEGDEDGYEKHAKKGKKNRNRAKKKKDAQKKMLVPVIPFVEHPEYRVFASDKWIIEHVLFCAERSSGVYGKTPERFVPMKLADVWYSEQDSEAAMKHRIEALLLTEVGLDVITMDLVGQPSVQPAIEAYEKMYFNCRDENFGMSPSMQLTTRMAMPFGPLKMYLKKWEEVDPKDGRCIQDGRPLAKDSDVWKAIGATMGYDTLIYVWNWERRANGIKDKSLKHKLECTWHSAVSRIMTSLFTGEMKHEDAARMLATCTAQLKFLDDSTSGRGGGAGTNEMMTVMMGMLEATAPEMISFDEGEAAEASRNEEIESRIQSQLEISRQTIDDKGEDVSKAVIDDQISNALS